jgi:rhodanese-related sulfurtransferase
MKTGRYLVIAVVLFIAGPAFPGYGWSANEQVEKNVLSLWLAVKKEVPQIPAAVLKSAMDRGDKFVLLDIRNDADYQAAHLPGAVHITRGDLEFEAPSKLPDIGAKIYVYCRTGVRSTFAAKRLLDIGYTNVVRVSDSFEGWVKAGYPVYNRHGEFVLVPNGFEKKE